MAGEDYTEILLSDPQVWVNEIDIGFFELPVKFTIEYDLFEYWRHLPQEMIFQVNMMTKPKLAIGMEQINIANMSTALGGEAIETIAGTPVDETMQQKTVIACPFSSGVNYVLLDGENVTDGVGAPVVKDYTEVTTYDEGDDYIVDYINGYLFINPNGAISLNDVLHITYQYTPAASSFVCFGQVTSMQQVKVKVRSESLLDGSIHEIYFDKASVAPKAEIDFGEPKKQSTLAHELTSVRSASYQHNGKDAPLGYYKIIAGA